MRPSNCFFTAVVLIVVTVECVKMPNYIEPCSISAPDLNDCALKSTRRALQRMVKGDRTYKLPRLDPINISEIIIQSGNNLKIKLTHCEVIGIGSSDIKNVNFDFENNYFSSEFFIDRFNLRAKYTIRGGVLVVPIEGQGPLNITMKGASFKYSFNFKLVEKENLKYIVPLEAKVKFETARSYFELGDLFGGNELLGSAVNNFLDDNWKAAQNQLKPDVSGAIANIITSIARSYIDRIPISEMFLP